MLLLFLQSTLISQVSFTNRNDLLSGSYYSGVSIGVADMNGDKLDDIIHFDDARILMIEYQTPNQAFETYEYGNISNNNQWSMCVADVDNNGYNDVLSGGYYDGVKVFMANAAATEYSMSVMPGASVFIQGSNFADINNDGFVDAFTCHDDAESRIYGNNGDGSFFEADDWIDMATDPVSDNSGNYGSVWSDFDNDGDLDLYIAKCRQGVNSPSDPRRINALFVNDGNNNFTESAEAYGLKIGAQSWTADFADYDNDGDMDCFITNHDVPSMLLEQDENGYFNDVTEAANIEVDGLPVQGVMKDFNNDGFVDILVAGTDHHLFINNGDKTFDEVETIFDNDDMESYAIGDLNHDGCLDVYGGYAEIYTSPSDIEDKIWMNDNLNPENNFVTFNLVGTTSNRNAIGARVEIYGNWGVQVREVRAGESYGIMNSFQVHFGLGTTNTIDEVVIRWPSGIVQTLEDLEGNQFITVVEEECVSPSSVVTVNGETTICSGESVELVAPEGYTYLWSNGATSQSIVVEEAGSYLVTVFDGSECASTSAAVIVEVDPIEIPTIELIGDLEFCEGGSIILESSEAASYMWSTGETTQSITVTETGTYSVTTEGLCDNFDSEIIEVEVFAADTPMADDVELPEPGPATLEATGENPQWYEMPFGGDPVATGNTFVTPDITENTTYYVEDLGSFAITDYEGGQTEHTGSNFFNGDNFNGTIEFDAHKGFILKQVTMSTDTPGERIIELQDSDDVVWASFTVMVEEGTNVYDVEIVVPEGDGWSLTTNEAQNNTVLGHDSPRLYRSNQMVEYPYPVGDAATINASGAGLNWYYYFYDWKIETLPINCASDRIPVEITLLPNSVTDILTDAKWTILPNPNAGQFMLNLDNPFGTETEIQLINSQGQVIQIHQLAATQSKLEIALETAAPGLYLVQWKTDAGVSTKKVIVE